MAKKKPHGNTRYPWKKWLNGKTHKARRFKDFDTEIASFQNMLHITAKRRGYDVESRSKGDWVTFQFTLLTDGSEGSHGDMEVVSG